ncbi:hypothetical protein [Marinitenerispora sediminis]|uniref:hypothetical protein n=1 Tax=Marinitenerispora sediminis TaxID=1931232 RepID=UPI001313EEEA|nr:hypothetical protein [Marinitenerispora sediminis]
MTVDDEISTAQAAEDARFVRELWATLPPRVRAAVLVQVLTEMGRWGAYMRALTE